MRALCIAMVLALAASTLPAQQLRGRVVLADSVTPGAGVVIEAVFEGDASVRMRALTGSRGNYVLVLPRPGSYRLSGLRIGYVPTDFGSIAIAAGETRSQELVMANTAVQLAVVRVDARAQCGREVAGGSTVASLLTQVRTALGAVTLVSTDGQLDAQWHTHRIIVDHRRVPLAGPWETVRRGATQRPFASVSLVQLSNEGFVRVLADGGVVYRAPDADVLLSEWFVSTHCFAVVEDRARPELIGLRFTPARVRSEITDIRGTLWLSRVGTKLESVEFGYVGLPRYLEGVNPGGSLRFAQLPDGAWIVHAWELRMPRPVRAFLIAPPGFGEGDVPMVVASIEHIGGQVTRVQRGDATLYEHARDPLARQFPALETPDAQPSCPAAFAYDAETRGLVYGMISTSEGTLPSSARAEISWRAPLSSGLRESERKQFRLVDAPDGFYMLCGLPFGSGITVQAVAPGYAPKSADARLSDRQRVARLPIVLEPMPTPP